ncbi:hypothetical protein [Macrococcoides canis]|uniref:hypothetical protein n=1 Tax=Macrococcoides canis TaxID=1855823 RepID=UPI0020B901AB|nr:hypothetical protein [Macrococcus canis]UTG99321.1 hypothetical protein KFV04_07355 [Macrococcus canis]
MARLSDLVNTSLNKNSVKIQGVDIPVSFTFASFEYVQEAYGQPYEVFEKDMNEKFANGKEVVLDKDAINLMVALIYSMVRSGGTECTPDELLNSIPQSELPEIFQAALDIFNNQIFQESDSKKIKKEKK